MCHVAANRDEWNWYIQNFKASGGTVVVKLWEYDLEKGCDFKGDLDGDLIRYSLGKFGSQTSGNDRSR